MTTAVNMTEQQLQGAVLELAAWTHWLSYHVFDSRRSTPGFPDLILCRRDRLIAAELKSMTGKVTPAQAAWLAAFEAAGVEVHTWRPSSWTSGEIEEALR